jgi:hypothetical protein
MTTGSAIRHFTLDLDDHGWTTQGLAAPCAGPRLQFPTSVCFAGPDLRTVYVGSPAVQRLPTFRSPVPGLPMSHWR